MEIAVWVLGVACMGLFVLSGWLAIELAAKVNESELAKDKIERLLRCHDTDNRSLAEQVARLDRIYSAMYGYTPREFDPEDQ